MAMIYGCHTTLIPSHAFLLTHVYKVARAPHTLAGPTDSSTAQYTNYPSLPPRVPSVDSSTQVADAVGTAEEENVTVREPRQGAATCRLAC
jgi:hypothetical protein